MTGRRSLRNAPVKCSPKSSLLAGLKIRPQAKNNTGLPYVRQMVDLGLKGAAARLQTFSPELAIRFLDGEFDPQKDYTENKFLTPAWETLLRASLPF